MFRLLYSDGTTSAEASSVNAALALYAGALKAWLQQRRDGWVTISTEVNGREGEFIITVGDVSSNPGAAQVTDAHPVTTGPSQVASVDQNGEVTLT